MQFLRIWQLVPDQAGAHSHTYPSSCNAQVPPFIQEMLVQASPGAIMNTTQHCDYFMLITCM